MASICSFSLPSLAGSSTFSLPSIFACSLTLYNVIGWVLAMSSWVGQTGIPFTPTLKKRIGILLLLLDRLGPLL